MLGGAVRIFMKSSILIVVFLLAGCGSTATLEELEEEAMISGDWSKVEKRERRLRQQNQVENDCDSGMTLVCYDKGAGEECMCRRRGRLP